VGEIANRCGYTSIYGFSRAFKRAYGLSPRAYRQHATESRM
jgi:AraC family transcriptional regulator of arabinose operon